MLEGSEMVDQEKTANGPTEEVYAGGIPSGALAYLEPYSVEAGCGKSKSACVRFAVVAAAKDRGYEPTAPVPA